MSRRPITRASAPVAVPVFPPVLDWRNFSNSTNTLSVMRDWAHANDAFDWIRGHARRLSFPFLSVAERDACNLQEWYSLLCMEVAALAWLNFENHILSLNDRSAFLSSRKNVLSLTRFIAASQSNHSRESTHAMVAEETASELARIAVLIFKVFLQGTPMFEENLYDDDVGDQSPEELWLQWDQFHWTELRQTWPDLLCEDREHKTLQNVAFIFTPAQLRESHSSFANFRRVWTAGLSTALHVLAYWLPIRNNPSRDAHMVPVVPLAQRTALLSIRWLDANQSTQDAFLIRHINKSAFNCYTSTSTFMYTVDQFYLVLKQSFPGAPQSFPKSSQGTRTAPSSVGAHNVAALLMTPQVSISLHHPPPPPDVGPSNQAPKKW
jgi:hypothetical protein